MEWRTIDIGFIVIGGIATFSASILALLDIYRGHSPLLIQKGLLMRLWLNIVKTLRSEQPNKLKDTFLVIAGFVVALITLNLIKYYKSLSTGSSLEALPSLNSIKSFIVDAAVLVILYVAIVKLVILLYHRSHDAIEGEHDTDDD